MQSASVRGKADVSSSASVLFGSLLAACASSGLISASGAIASVIALDTKLVAGGASFAVPATLIAAYLLSASAASRTYAYTGARTTVALGACMVCLGLLCGSVSATLGQLLVCLAVIGGGCALVALVSSSHPQHFVTRYRATAAGFVLAGSGASAVFGPYLRAWGASGGWRYAFERASIAEAVLLVVACFLLTPAPSAPIVTGTSEVGSGIVSTRALLHKPGLLAFLSAAALLTGANASSLVYLQLNAQGLALSAGDELLRVQGIALVVARLLLGIVGDLRPRLTATVPASSSFSLLLRLGVVLTLAFVLSVAATLLRSFPLCTHPRVSVAFAALLGVSSAQLSLTPPILVDLVGVASLPSALATVDVAKAPAVVLLHALFSVARGAHGFSGVWAVSAAAFATAAVLLGASLRAVEATVTVESQKPQSGSVLYGTTKLCRVAAAFAILIGTVLVFQFQSIPSLSLVVSESPLDSCHTTPLTACPDALAVVIVHFNPANFSSRVAHTLASQVRLGASDGVELYTVELAYGDAPFSVTSSSNLRHLQLRLSHEDSLTPLWAKEALFNAAIARIVPHTCSALALVDAEVTFHSPHWARAALRMLNAPEGDAEGADVLQLFSSVSIAGASPITSFAFEFVAHGRDRLAAERVAALAERRALSLGHPGYAVALSRKAWSSLGGLLVVPFPSQCFTLSAATGEAEFSVGSRTEDLWAFLYANVSLSLTQQVQQHYARGARAHLRLGCVEGILEHSAHGTLERRQYRVMHDWLQAARFSSINHTRTTVDGLPVASADMPQSLSEAFQNYWHTRDEDGATS